MICGFAMRANAELQITFCTLQSAFASQASRAADSSRRIHGRIPNRLLSYLTPPDSSSGVWSVKGSPHGPLQSSPNRAYPCQTAPPVPAGHRRLWHRCQTLLQHYRRQESRSVVSNLFQSPRGIAVLLEAAHLHSIRHAQEEIS